MNKFVVGSVYCLLSPSGPRAQGPDQGPGSQALGLGPGPARAVTTRMGKFKVDKGDKPSDKKEA